MITGTEQAILSYLAENTAKKHTIRQIALSLKKSYPHIYNTVKKLKKNKILILEKIGQTQLCTPNCKEELTRNILAHIEIQKTQKAIKKNPELAKTEKTIKRLTKNYPFLTIFSHNKTICFCTTAVFDQETVKQHFKTKTLFLNKQGLKEYINPQILNQKTILYKAETFYELLAEEVMKQ